MESNLLIYLPTIIVALATLATLVPLATLIPLITGGVGLRKPGRDLRGGVGNHQHQREEDQVHCGEMLRSLLLSSSITSRLLFASLLSRLLSKISFFF